MNFYIQNYPYIFKENFKFKFSHSPLTITTDLIPQILKFIKHQKIVLSKIVGSIKSYTTQPAECNGRNGNSRLAHLPKKASEIREKGARGRRRRRRRVEPMREVGKKSRRVKVEMG